MFLLPKLLLRFFKTRLGVAAFFTTSGVLHLTAGKKFFESIVPPWLPASAETVNVAAGYAEIAGGALAVTPGARGLARKYLVALLLAVFPANCHMAVKPEDSGSEKIPAWALWGRLPLQFLLIRWVGRTLGDPATDAAVTAPAE